MNIEVEEFEDGLAIVGIKGFEANTVHCFETIVLQ